LDKHCKKETFGGGVEEVGFLYPVAARIYG